MDVEWKLASDPTQRVSQSATELCVMLGLPDDARKSIHGWVLEQDWPEGTELHEPEKYHITLMYTPDGHHEHKDADWIEHMEKAEVRIVGIDVFTQDDEGRYPYVLRLHAPEVKKHAEEMQSRAEEHGLEITHFPGGYKPHITVGYGPEEKVGADEVVELEFHAGPSFVSPPRGDKESKTAALWTTVSRERGESGFVENLVGEHADMIIDPKLAVKAPIPPKLRDASGKDRCGNCKMFDRALEVCWGFGNRGADDDPPVTEYKVCDDYYPAPGYHESGMPDHYDPTTLLDGLSLRSVAHNLHHAFGQGRITDAAAAKDYAERLLDMIGYPRDDMNTQAALQAWSTLYPAESQQLGGAQAPATIPTESWGYGTTSRQNVTDLIQHQHADNIRIHHGAAYAGSRGLGDSRGQGHGVAAQQQPLPDLSRRGSGRADGAREGHQPQSRRADARRGSEDGVGLLAGSRTARRGSAGWTSPELDHILDSFNRAYGVTLLADEDPSQVSFNHIEIPPENRGNGVGRRVMQQLKSYADRSGKQLNVQHVVNYPFFAGLGWMQFQAPDQFTYSPSTEQEPYTQEGSTEPTPTDRWPDHGKRPEDELHHHDIQFGNDWV